MGERFFASGQAYVALSRVRNLSDLVLWEFDPSAIHLEPFYQQLLQWCDNVDVIRPTPPTDVVEYPERSHDLLSNEPIPEPSMNDDNPKSGSIQINFDPSNLDAQCNSTKRGRGRPRKNIPSDTSIQTQPKRGRGRPRKSDQPKPGSIQLDSEPSNVNPQSTSIMRGRGRPRKNTPSGSSTETQPKRGRGHPRKSQPPDSTQCNATSNIDTACHPKPQVPDSTPKRCPPKRANSDSSGQPPSKVLKVSTPFSTSTDEPLVHTNVTSACVDLLRRVQQLLGGSPQSVLATTLSLNSIQEVIDSLNGMHEAFEAIVQAVNALPPVYASHFSALPTAMSVSNQCHPLMLQTYKPVLTTGDGDCMYHALSRVVCGSEQLSRVFRLLIAYATVKYRDILIQALQHAFPTDPYENHVRKANTLIVHALRTGTWGSDFHLFPLSLLLDRPIFTYVYFYTTSEDCVRTLMLADIDNVHMFAQKFLAFASGTRQHLQWCSSAQRALLMSGDVTTLPHLPLALFFAHSHFTALVPLSSAVLQHVPIPFGKVLDD